MLTVGNANVLLKRAGDGLHLTFARVEVAIRTAQLSGDVLYTQHITWCVQVSYNPRSQKSTNSHICFRLITWISVA